MFEYIIGQDKSPQIGKSLQDGAPQLYVGL